MSIKQPGPSDDAGYQAQVTGSRGVQVGSGNTQTNIEVDAAGLPPAQRVGDGVTIHNLPRASAIFVGRDLTVLADQLDGEGAGVVVGQAAVHGLGGIGKSELVNHYARQYLARYSLVWWITADTPENLGLGLAALTRRLHPAATLANAQAWAAGWLQGNAGWLLVLDNVEDVNDIADLLGVVSGQGQVLVTTRRDLGTARWARFGLTPFRLGVLTRPAAVDLLIRLTGRSEDAEAASLLAAELGDLPLALEQAAAYIAQHDRMDFGRYLALLSAQFDRVAADAGQGGTPGRSVAAVWAVTMATIAQVNPLAAQVLDVLSWLAPDDLPDDLLAPLAGSPADIDDALALLVSYSMISRQAGYVSVHRLVQAVTRSTQSAAGTSAAVQGQAVALLALAIPENPMHNVRGWPRWDVLLPHTEALAGNLPADHQFAAMLDIEDGSATYQLFQGRTKAAIAKQEKLLANTRRVLGTDHPDALISRHNLALAYRMAGRVTEAITEYEAVLADWRRLLGAEDPDTLIGRSNLADAYKEAGRVSEAISEYEAVLADWQRVRGEDMEQLDSLHARNNLALAYRMAGRVTEAITESAAVVAGSVRVLGAEHPDTLIARNTLAGAYQAAGRVSEAITAYQAVLADQLRVLGADHPDTLTSRSNLADATRMRDVSSQFGDS